MIKFDVIGPLVSCIYLVVDVQAHTLICVKQLHTHLTSSCCTI